MRETYIKLRLAMKKLLPILLAAVLLLSLAGCQKTMECNDERMIEKVREEIPVADADTIEIAYAGLCGKDDQALIWFISGNEYQAHYYFPMECDVVGKNEYTFVRTYKPMDCAMDIAALQWKRGYCFLINNPDCVAIRITDSTGTHESVIEKDAYPYINYNELPPTEYAFLDAEGNELC